MTGKRGRDCAANDAEVKGAEPPLEPRPRIGARLASGSTGGRRFMWDGFHPWTRVVVGGVVTTSLLLVACQRAATPTAAPATPPPPAVSAEAAHRGDIQQALAYSGDIRAKSSLSTG